MAKKTEATPAAKHADVQKAYHAQRKEDGWKRRAVWVPGAALEDFDKAVVRMKKKWVKDGLC
jgi:hypothetical protein